MTAHERRDLPVERQCLDVRTHPRTERRRWRPLWFGSNIALDAWAVGWESAGSNNASVPGIRDPRHRDPARQGRHLGACHQSQFGHDDRRWRAIDDNDARSNHNIARAGDDKNTTTAAPSTTTLPTSGGAGASPTLGSAAWGIPAGSYAGISGFGEVAPSSFSEGDIAQAPHVDSITWSNWGAPEAMGQGQAIDGTGQNGTVWTYRPEKTATVVVLISEPALAAVRLPIRK